MKPKKSKPAPKSIYALSFCGEITFWETRQRAVKAYATKLIFCDIKPAPEAVIYALNATVLRA